MLAASSMLATSTISNETENRCGLSEQEIPAATSCNLEPESCDYSSAFSISNRNMSSSATAGSSSHHRASPKFDDQSSHSNLAEYSVCSPSLGATNDFESLSSSPDDSRQSSSNRNKRKNFQPRYITDEEDDGDDEKQANQQADEGNESMEAEKESAVISNGNSAFALNLSQPEPTSLVVDARAKQLTELALLLKNIRQLYPQLAAIPEALLLPLVANGGMLNGFEPMTQGPEQSNSKLSKDHGSASLQDMFQEEYLRMLQDSSSQPLSKEHQQEEDGGGDQMGDHIKSSDGEEQSSTSNFNEDDDEEGHDEPEAATVKPEEGEDGEDEDREHELGGESKDESDKDQKMLDLERLKQIESLYRLNMLQHQHLQPMSLSHETLMGMPKRVASHEKAQVGGIYGKVPMVPKPGNSAKAPVSRRPLSSWKQSISVCGPGPAPWVDKATLISLGIQVELMSNKSSPIDYTHYVKRYANAAECGNSLCRELNYREHFHCNAQSCNARVFMKKEEMIRHFKWHKKRDESLTHGFLRCSPIDPCIERFTNCPHHRKQTHYHCLKRGCDKVYISTSDVQMHANYHRKDTAIIQEGFQRFRATENCLLESCAFFGQKTTHFHCKRDNCNHTFKNKADMEKHKSYHVRDEQLARDGFKKFMKHETCSFEDCRSSRVCNHIHCIRPGCTHVLHSTGQLYPHRRKHERRESELAYRKYRLAQAIHRTNNNNNSLLEGLDSLAFNEGGFDSLNDEDTTFEALAAHLPLAQMANVTLEEIMGKIPESRTEPYMERHKQSPDCSKQAETLSEQHFACRECVVPRQCWNGYEMCLEHARRHVMQEEATRLMFEEVSDVNTCTAECALHASVRHLHCRMYGCPTVIPLGDRSLARLEHYKFHEEQQAIFLQEQEMSGKGLLYNNNNKTSNKHMTIEQLLQLRGSNPSIPGLLNLAPNRVETETSNKAAATGGISRSSPKLQVFPTGTTLTSVDGLPVLKRKRGRPPKNRGLEGVQSSLAGSSSGQSGGRTTMTPTSNTANFSPLAPLSAFDLAAALNLPLRHAHLISNIQGGTADEACKTIPVPMIMPYLRPFATGGFYAFDADIPCPDLGCRHFRKRHFHCSKPRCFYESDQEGELNGHAQDFHEAIDIMEGFVYFDQAIDCKLSTCQSNRRASHFHCTRAGCSFSFVQYSAMAWHETEAHAQRNSRSEDENEDGQEDEKESAPASSDADNKARLNGNDIHDAAKSFDMFHSLQRLLHEQQQQQQQQPTSSPNEVSFCDQASCRLRRVHHHCAQCSQIFSSVDHLVAHTLKHEEQLKPMSSSQQDVSSELDMLSESNRAVHYPHEMSAELSQQQQQQSFFQLLMSSFMGQQQQQQQHPLLPFNPVMAAAAAAVAGSGGEANFVDLANEFKKHQQASKRKNSFSSDGSDKRLCSTETESKSPAQGMDRKTPTGSSNKISVMEEPSPNGYLRFRFNESCGFPSCVYREHQTHFHCMRKNCFYSFCDKTRFVQHTARHERMDTLMGGDFQQYRSTVSCGRAGCEYLSGPDNSPGPVSSGAKTSHYHCLKCTYTCADTNRVVAHRRQHEKMENIAAAGFERFVPGVDCRKEACNYRSKQTHYHCSTCNYSVLGLSQMSAHKARHEQQIMLGKASHTE